MLILLLNAMHLLMIGVHCYCRAKFHLNTFKERDAFGDWALEQYLIGTPAALRVVKANRQWHKWFFLMIATINAAYISIAVAAHYSQSLLSICATMGIGIALYGVLINPLIARIALGKSWFYISERDVETLHGLPIGEKVKPEKLYFIIRLAILGLAIALKVFIL